MSLPHVRTFYQENVCSLVPTDHSRMKSLLDWLQHNKEWVFSGIGVSIVFAVVSRLISFVKSRAFKRRSSSLQVNLAFGCLAYGPRLSEQMLLFTIANPSNRPVQLTSIRLPLKKSSMVFPHLAGEKRLPCMIAPGTNVKFWVELSDVQASIQSRGYTGSAKVHAVATDALGNEYKSNVVSLM
jgi:hypothetical protein